MAARRESGIIDKVSTKYDVFLSYRREDGSALAQLFATELKARGYQVFLDVTDMPAGPFPDAIRTAISSCGDFVPLLTPASLTRGRSRSDWFFEEIRHALATRRNIVPVRTEGFVAPDTDQDIDLPGFLELHQILYTHDYTAASFDALCGRLVARPATRHQIADTLSSAPASANGAAVTKSQRILDSITIALSGGAEGLFQGIVWQMQGGCLLTVVAGLIFGIIALYIDIAFSVAFKLGVWCGLIFFLAMFPSAKAVERLRALGKSGGRDGVAGIAWGLAVGVAVATISVAINRSPLPTPSAFITACVIGGAVGAMALQASHD